MAAVKENKKLKRQVSGRVAGFSSPNTVKVRIESKFPHKKYGKIIKRHTHFLAHIEEAEAKKIAIGDEITIEETRPMSKRKSWKYVANNKE